MSRIAMKNDSTRKSANFSRSSGVTPKATLNRSNNFSIHNSTNNVNGTGPLFTSSSKLHSSSKNLNDTANIEAEYIKNLQQQIYFLELEANYLREQCKKATEMQPLMTAEAERMVSKLRTMQTEIDSFKTEMRRKDASLEVNKATIERLELRLKTEQESHSREKRLLLDELVSLRKDKESAERDMNRKEAQLRVANQQSERTSEALSKAETRLDLLRKQNDSQSITINELRDELDEKRKELLSLEMKIRELEKSQYENAQHATNTLNFSNEEKFVKYERQIKELRSQLQAERSAIESSDERRTAQLSELISSRERERRLEDEVEELKRQLRSERNQRKDETDLENETLRKEKSILERQLDSLEKEKDANKLLIYEMENKIKHFRVLEDSLKGHEWGELNRLADGIKTLSKSLNTV